MTTRNILYRIYTELKIKHCLGETKSYYKSDFQKPQMTPPPNGPFLLDILSTLALVKALHYKPEGGGFETRWSD
jgi:hypothetical protein